MMNFITTTLAPYGVLGLVAVIFFNYVIKTLNNQAKQQEMLMNSMIERNSEDLIAIKNRIDTILEAVSSHNVNSNESFNKIAHTINTDKADFSELRNHFTNNMTYIDNEIDDLKAYLTYLEDLLTEARLLIDKANPESSRVLNDLLIHGILDKQTLENFYKEKTRQGIDGKNIGRHKTQAGAYKSNRDEKK